MSTGSTHYEFHFYGASIMKSKKMFTFSDHHIVCESPKEIIHAWEKVKKNGF